MYGRILKIYPGSLAEELELVPVTFEKREMQILKEKLKSA